MTTTKPTMNEKPTVAVLSMAELVAKSPDPVAAIKTLGASIARSQMMGPTDRAEIGEVIVMLCITNGWTLAELFRSYQISFGRLEKKIDAGMAEFLGRGGRVVWITDGSDGQTARARFTLGTDSIEASCSVDEAKRAGWMKNSKWTTEPQTMLRARVKKRGIVALAPDIFFGEYDDSEKPEPSVTVDAAQMARAAAAVAPVPTPAVVPPPAATPAPEPAPAPAPARSLSETLTEKMQERLVEIIGEDRIAEATAWAVSVNWLPAGATLEDLPEKHAKAIIAKPDRFKAALEKFIAAHGGAK